MPYLGSTLFVTTLALLFLLSLFAALILAYALMRGSVERAAGAADDRPKTALLVGLPLTAGALLLLIALAHGGGPARGLALFLGLCTLAVALIGLSGFALKIGAALPARVDLEAPYRRVARGAAVLLVACAMPVFGWFVVLPLSISLGLGAVVLGPRRAAHRAVPGGAYHVPAQ